MGLSRDSYRGPYTGVLLMAFVGVPTEGFSRGSNLHRDVVGILAEGLSRDSY